MRLCPDRLHIATLKRPFRFSFIFSSFKVLGKTLWIFLICNGSISLLCLMRYYCLVYRRTYARFLRRSLMRHNNACSYYLSPSCHDWLSLSTRGKIILATMNNHYYPPENSEDSCWWRGLSSTAFHSEMFSQFFGNAFSSEEEEDDSEELSDKLGIQTTAGNAAGAPNKTGIAANILSLSLPVLYCTVLTLHDSYT